MIVKSKVDPDDIVGIRYPNKGITMVLIDEDVKPMLTILSYYRLARFCTHLFKVKWIGV